MSEKKFDLIIFDEASDFDWPDDLCMLCGEVNDEYESCGCEADVNLPKD